MARKKVRAESSSSDEPEGSPGTPRRRVQIVCDERTRVGTRLLKNGDITEDPAYVALLDDPRGLVREVE